MKTLKLYGVALLRVLAPFIVLMAIAVIMNTDSWKYLIEYFLVSNFFLFFPYIFLKYRNDKLKKMKYVDEIDDSEENEDEIKYRRRSNRREDKDWLETAEDRDNAFRESSTHYLIVLVYGFVKYTILLVGAPIIFLYYMLFKNDFEF